MAPPTQHNSHTHKKTGVEGRRRRIIGESEESEESEESVKEEKITTP